MIDAIRKIDVLPGGAICINERRPEIKIVDDDLYFVPRAMIELIRFEFFSRGLFNQEIQLSSYFP